MNLYRDDQNRLCFFLSYADEIDVVLSDIDGVLITLTEEMEDAVSMDLQAFITKENASR